MIFKSVDGLRDADLKHNIWPSLTSSDNKLCVCDGETCGCFNFNPAHTSFALSENKNQL